MDLFGKQAKLELEHMTIERDMLSRANDDLEKQIEKLNEMLQIYEEQEKQSYQEYRRALHEWKAEREALEDAAKVLTATIEDLKTELEDERERHDALISACAESMEAGWQPVPESLMTAGGFRKNEDGTWDAVEAEE